MMEQQQLVNNMKSTPVLFFLLFVSGLRAAPRQTITPHVINGLAQPVQHAAAIFAVVDANNNGVFGAGSIISDRHILTGANIILGALSVRAVFGGTALSGLTPVTSTTFVAHPGFNRTTMENDIAIVFLTTADRITFSELVRAIALPSADATVGLAGRLGGWGFTQSNAPGFSDTLLVANLITVAPTVCSTRWSVLTMSTSFCADGAPNEVMPALRSNICAGDYGGGFYTGDGFIPTTTTEEPTEEPPEEGVEEEEQEEEDENVFENVEPFDPTKVIRSASVSEGEPVEPILFGVASVVGNWWECNPEDPRAYTSVFLFIDWIRDLTGIE